MIHESGSERNDFEATSKLTESKTPTGFAETWRTSGAATDSSGYSLNGSDPPTPTDNNLTMSSETPHVKTYRPYDIEEPDEDLNVAAQRVELLSLPDDLERWQRDLMHSMDDSGNERTEDLNPNPLFDLQQRGHKRRNPSFLAAEHESRYQNHRPMPQVKSGDRPASAPGSSPKQRQKRNKVIDESTQVTPMLSLYDFRDTQVSSSSSSDLPSPDDSADCMQEEFAITDEMDMD
ncbi:uncharacterized protein N7483_007250 [Penicillium malachiteum]|uniref:uncharacterized protein n=1 Tax=Penicillium malachiteum TaxID=1324776 RepID=UPI0025476A4A|nr:uncharacterized protein N7483_007250 [Penicillium malachiteum]KAJ5725893.1 hypothetical protein N7483_007250 [Penicillium malachiteum]